MTQYLSHEEVEKSVPISRDEILPWLIENYDRMAPEDRYRETLEAYTRLECTYNFPKKLLIGLKKIKPADYLKDLPSELKTADLITVYRGTDHIASLSSVRTSPSWTIDKNVAIWFSQRTLLLRSPLPGKVFSATIEKEKIIAYMGDSESEIIQHCGVKNVKEISITQTEIDAAREAHRKKLEASGFNC